MRFRSRSRSRSRSRVMLHAGAGFLVLGAVLAPTAANAAVMSSAPSKDADDIEVVNTETVQAYADATGTVDTSRLYEQLALTGSGTTTVHNPALTDGLRNLDGFGGFDVVDGEQVVKVDVDGTENFRTVSDFDGTMPIEIEAHYLLDGTEVDPADLVGATGDLEVSYTVTNITGRTQKVTFDDGHGGTVSKDVEVSVPMVGSLTTVLPTSFRDVTSDQANMAGDGRGATKLSFTMTLVPPVGSDTTTFGYRAHVDDAVVPRASVTALPVNPLKSPTFKSAGESYAGGAETGIELTAGAAEIDSNLLKLRDGAGDLLAGLIKLRDGATELNDGLAGKAVPGAGRLADGAAELSDGLNGKAVPGAEKLADGTAAAAAGGDKLHVGLTQMSAGLDQLGDVDGLPAAAQAVTQLQAGVDVILAGFGSTADANSLVGGLAKLQGSLGQLHDGQAQVAGGIGQVANGLPTAKGGVDQVNAGLQNAVRAGGSLDTLRGGLASLKAYCAGDPQCIGTIDALIAGVQSSKQDLSTASAGLTQVSSGLQGAITALTAQILPGATQVRDGLAAAQAGAGTLGNGANQLRGGVAQVQGGLDQLSVGLAGAVSGVLQLSDGASTAATKSGELADGLGTIDAGTHELAGKLGDAGDGSGLLADGAAELAEKLGDAAEGSGLIADGLTTAAGKAPALGDGAQRLSDEGTSKLVEAGEDTAQEYGQMYATLAAGADRAQTESMVVGAPDDAIGLAAYTFELEGENGEGSRNLVRGLVGLGLFAAAGATVLLRRRLA